MRDLIKQILREETSDMKDMIFNIINDSVEGVDFYKNKGELWLIFTDSKQWVIRLTERGDLYYNYDFFKNIFKYLSMDVVENQYYITEWVEDTIQNGVRRAFKFKFALQHSVEDTIQNGVRSTFHVKEWFHIPVEDTIQNGKKLNKS